MMTYLANVDKETFWGHRTWADFAAMPEKERTLVVVPFCGMADWGLGHPLDCEEMVAMSVLKRAVEVCRTKVPVMVLPPLRFVLGPYPNCAFSIDPDTAYQFVEEVVRSIHVSGFQKLVLFNSSPWNEDIVNKACARDLRIKFGLQMFSINLHGIGLDFHPVRSNSRREVQTLATFLSGWEPEWEGSAGKPIPSDGLAIGEPTHGSALVDAVSLAEALEKGPRLLESSGRRLARLFQEIHARKPLPGSLG